MTSNPVSIYYKDYINEELTSNVVYKNTTELLSKYKQHLNAFPNKDITFETIEPETLSNFTLNINLNIPDKQVVNIVLNLTLKGSSTITLEGSNYSVKNLVITEGDKSKTFSSHIVQVKGKSIKLVNFSMTNYQVKNADLDYIRVYSKNFELHNSLIQDKTNKGVFLRLDFPENHIIKQCIFKNFRKPSATNGGEMIRCATGGYQNQKSYCIIESCFFKDCDGDPEVVSIKCSNITIRKCIFISNRGKLVLRHTHGCLIENNYFCDNGIRAYGTNHKFLNNQLDNGASLLLDNKKGSYIPAKDCIIDGLFYTNSVKTPIINKGINCKVSNVKNELVISEINLHNRNQVEPIEN